MKRIILATGLTAFLVAQGVTAEDQKSSSTKPECEKQNQLQTDTRYLRMSDLLGASVRTKDATGLGEIQDLILHTATGKIQFALLGKSDGLGISRTVMPVPWQAVSVGAQKQYIVSVNPEKIGVIPTLGDDESQLGQPDYILHVYRFYQLEPVEGVGAPGTDVGVESDIKSSDIDDDEK